MNESQNTKEKINVDNSDIEVDFSDVDIEEFIPTMNVNNDIIEEKECVVSDDSLVGLYSEILDNCRNDRKNVDEVLSTFIDMVINDGDASSASKEAIVNLMKIKSDTSDKMSKVADLMTRIKLKDKDTFPRYLSAQQNNKVVIEGGKREMIKKINKIAARKKNEKQDK